MLENTIASLLVALSGISAGSYANPTRRMTKWNYENIWTIFSLFTFFILPWTFTLIFEPKIFTVYTQLATSQLLIMIIGGLIFGLGQILFTMSLSIIGIGLAFAINLGLSTGLGFLLPLIFQHSDKLLTTFGIITISGVIITLTGLSIFAYAGNLRDKEKQLNCMSNTAESDISVNNNTKNNSSILGIIMVSIAGLASAGQNFSFSLTYPTQELALKLGMNELVASNIIWPIFLMCTGFVFIIFTLSKNYKNKSFNLYTASKTKMHYVYALAMALLWYSPLIFYSKASKIFGSIGPLVFWPIFMILIILTSNVWGWKNKEWHNTSKKTARIALTGLGLLVLAIFVLGFGSFTNLCP